MCQIDSHLSLSLSLQVLGKLYAVLSDKEQRAVYNEQGVVDEESDVLAQDRCWDDYWRLLFPKVMEEEEDSLVMSDTFCFVFTVFVFL